MNHNIIFRFNKGKIRSTNIIMRPRHTVGYIILFQKSQITSNSCNITAYIMNSTIIVAVVHLET